MFVSCLNLSQCIIKCISVDGSTNAYVYAKSIKKIAGWFVSSLIFRVLKFLNMLFHAGFTLPSVSVLQLQYCKSD